MPPRRCRCCARRSVPRRSRTVLHVRRSPWIAIAIGAIALVAYWLADFRSGASSPEFVLLADAFLHGRTWIDPSALHGPWDRIDIDGRTYLPFAPLPALVFMPLVAAFGAAGMSYAQPFLNALLAATCVVLGYLVIRRFDGGVLRDRLWLTALFAFSTPLVTITARGGPWHQDQLLATICSLAAILEAGGRRRGLLLGALGGAAFLARAPVLLALPLYAWATATREPARPAARDAARAVALVAAGAVPAVAFALWYNAARFGSPTESGYAIAALPPFLEVLRAQGLFSLAHVPRNLEYFLLHRPVIDGPPLYVRPDGFGLSVLLTSPGLFVGATARRLEPFLIGCGLTALVVFVPSLLYYGGGWVQSGFRYFLDAIPFLLPIIAAASRTGLGGGWKLLIAAGIAVNVWTIPWVYGY